MTTFRTILYIAFASTFGLAFLLMAFGLPNFISETDVVVAIKSGQIAENVRLIAQTLEETVPSWFAGEQREVLSVSGVVKGINQEREYLQLPPLQENTELYLAAEEKLDDMFLHQYFEHVSPDGKGPSYFAQSAGYEYIIVGENIALGDFESDATLVQAWMDSPDHKANIVSEKYLDTGVAVRRGMFQGQDVWLAVQVFGRPMSLCTPVSDAIKSRIDYGRARLDRLDVELDDARKELDTVSPKNEKEREVYNQLIEKYNSLVRTYKSEAEVLKEDIENYNTQVRNYNECVGL